MRIIISIIFTFLLSCSSKYNGLHNNLDKFNEDVLLCLKKTCNKEDKNKSYSFSIISSLHAYGGGGGGGMSNSSSNHMSLKLFNLCMKKKGYYKDVEGTFVMPKLTCNNN